MDKDERVVAKIEEDAPFDITPFDEKEFIRKELISFRTTAILFVFAILVAGICFALWKFAGLNFGLLLLVALVLAVSLRFIFKAAKIDISHWKRREWTGTMFMFFFFWLGFFLLFANPPFTDAATPAIQMDAVPAAQAPGKTVVIGAYVADNTALAGEGPRFCVRPYTGDAPPALSAADEAACDDEWTRVGNEPFWTTNESRPEGKYAAYVIATDENGQSAVASKTFEVKSAFEVSLPRDNKFAHPDDSLAVRVHPSIRARTVQFSLDNGTWHHMAPHPDVAKRDANWWRTDPSYVGWKAGTFDVRIRVVPQPTYVRAADHKLFAIGEDGNGPYKLAVEANIPQLGTVLVNEGKGEFPEFPYFNPGQTPGLSTPLLLAAVAGIAFVGRRRAA